MEVRTQICIRRADVGDRLYGSILPLVDDRQASRGILRCDMRSDDSRLLRILDEMASGGFTPWVEMSRARNAAREYELTQYRKYDEDDWATCELLRLTPFEYPYPSSDDAEVMERTVDGLARVAVEEIPPRVDFLRAEGASALVPERVRSVLEGAGLRGILFRPTVPIRVVDARAPIVDCSWNDFPERWWELTSDVVLPPVSPSMAIASLSGKPVIRGATSVCSVSDGTGFFGHPELRYVRAELEALGPFDLAYSFEGPSPSGRDRAIVVSQRFYQACRKHNLSVSWVPVHVESDAPGVGH